MENSRFKTIYISNIQAASSSIGFVQELGELVSPSEIRWYPSGEQYDFHIVDGEEYILSEVLESNEGTLQFKVEYDEVDGGDVSLELVGEGFDDVLDSISDIVSEYNLDDEVELYVSTPSGDNEDVEFDEDDFDEVPHLIARLQQLTGARAVAWWTKEDIVDKYELSEDDAEEWLDEHEELLGESMIEAGWSYISNNINVDEN